MQGMNIYEQYTMITTPSYIPYIHIRGNYYNTHMTPTDYYHDYNPHTYRTYTIT